MGSVHQKTKDKLERIRELLNSGKSVGDACSEVGMNKSFYYQVKQKVAEEGGLKPPQKPKKIYEVLAVQEKKQITQSFMIMGTAEELAAFLVAHAKSGGAQ